MNSMQTQVATKKRLGAYSGGKATYASVAGNIFGSFQPLGASDDVVALGIVGQAYQFIADGSTDVITGDILTINSQDYTVKGVRRQTNGSVDELECLMQLATAD
jgi:hypothetical protein